MSIKNTDIPQEKKTILKNDIRKLFSKKALLLSKLEIKSPLLFKSVIGNIENIEPVAKLLCIAALPLGRMDKAGVKH